MPLILREAKGSKLTIPEMDGNLTYLEALANSGGSAIEVTYSELQGLIGSNDLIPGAYYTITDFKTCYDRPDYDQNKNPIAVSNDSYFQGPEEQIMVLATSANTLAVDAYQPIYPKDKIKYDVTYSTTESGNPAFGRITERIDEFNNRTDYDHINILFKRYRFYYYSKETPQTGTIEVLNDGTVNGTDTLFTNFTIGDIIAYPDSNEKFFKISSIDSDVLMTVTGLSINPYGGSNEFYLASDGNYDSYYRNNVDDIEDYNTYTTFGDAIDEDGATNNYIGDFSILYLEEGVGDFLLANNVFKDGPYINNIFGNACYNNTFNDDCTNNRIGNYFYNNITDDDFDGNVIGNYFNNNVITANFQYNRIGENFEDNQITNSDFNRNVIGNYFNNNWLDSDWGFDFENNQIGNQFNNNTIFREFIKNRILNGYNNNQIFREFTGNDIGNGFNENDIYQNFYDNRIKDYFEDNTIGDVNDIGNGVFEDNVIGNTFKGNNALGTFRNNQIGNEYISNQTEDYFYGNVIGNNFFVNNIDVNFANNQIGNDFAFNTIANDFGTGGGYQRGNRIGNGFYNNNIGEYFYDNLIADRFEFNVIGDYFTNNKIDQYFRSNTTIGFEFQNNDVKVGDIASADWGQNGILNSVINSNSPVGADGSYTGITNYTTSGHGISASFDVSIVSGVFNSVSINATGTQFRIGDTITIPAIEFGGNSDLILSVTDVITYVTYKKTNCTVSYNEDENIVLSYLDTTNTLQVDTLNFV